MNLNWRENEFRNIAIELIRRIQNFVGEVLMKYLMCLCQKKITIIIHDTRRLMCNIFWNS